MTDRQPGGSFGGITLVSGGAYGTEESEVLSSPRLSTLARTVTGALGTAVVATLIASAGTGAAAAQPPVPDQPPPASLGESDTGLWLVRLAEPSLAARDADRTAGALDPATATSQSYLDHLADRQAAVTGSIEEALGRPVEVVHAYRNVLNALAVRVSDAEAAALAGLPGVADVQPDLERELETDVSHELIRSAAIWDGGGPDLPSRGEGVVVGVLDSGINPDHPAFAATDGDGFTHTNPLGSGDFLGVCDPDHPEHEDICNDKLIGAWNLHNGSPSARDADGHGSHTASTAAGNKHEAAIGYGDDEFTRTVQGVAPRANLISYLVCFPGCPVSAMVAAVNQAIADRVDVLNFSISGSDNPWVDPVDRAFLEAAGAGIFISASAGNTGPGDGTVAKTGPWNAAVAASTTDRIFANPVTVTGPAPVPPELTGRRAWPGSGPALLADLAAELRYSGQVGNPNGCAAFPAGGFAGSVALIPFGTCTLDVKVNRAAAAGAEAVLLFDNQPGPPIFGVGLEGTAIPAFTLDRADGERLRDFTVDSDDPAQVQIGAATELVRDPAYADTAAWFSARGPSQFDLLAPTFAAPGVNVLAAYREVDGDPVQYLFNRGTSMAAPHGTGAGALLASLHPDWSPAQIRSALASTADPAGIRDQDGVSPADPFDVGSGRLDLDRAGRVGLVLDETHADFLAANPATGGDPRTLNVPAMVDQRCNLSCGWTREVTSVAGGPASYTAAVTAPAGMNLTVRPAAFTIQPGESVTLEITADVSGLSGGDWAFADVRLETGDQHPGGAAVAPVHYPVAVVPVAPALTVNPAEISVAQKPDRVAQPRLAIGNAGTGDLTWQLGSGDGCTDPDAVEWLDVAPRSGTVAPGGVDRLAVTLDSTGQPPGVLTATLCLDSNDPSAPLTTVPVTLTVQDLPTITVTPEALAVVQPGGTVTGTTVTIGNSGTAPLDWSIAEAADPEAAVADVDPGRLALLRQGVLLVPDTVGDRVLAFDPVTGDLIDPDFIPFREEANLATPGHVILNAEQDGFLLSDQFRHEIHAYDLNGQWQGVFAPAGGADTSVAQNIRGIAISPAGTLLATVASGPNAHAIAEFDAEGNYLGNFIDNGAGGMAGPWDILFRDSDILIAAVASSAIHSFGLDGTPGPVFHDDVPFPQQLHETATGNILVGQFSGTTTAGVWELDGAGNLLDIYPLRSGRGVYELPNGNILASSGGGASTGGVHELTRDNLVVDTKFQGAGARLITPVQLDRPCDTPGEVPWLAVEPASGTTPAGGSSEVTVLVDSADLAPGEHTAHLCVTSNDPDAPVVSVPVTVTVTEPACDRTVTGTGTHLGPLVVSGGLTCLAYGAEVTGPVSVRTGGSLFASGASVDGPISATGADVVELHGSELTGAVSVHAATGRVLLAGNQLTGLVSLVSNSTGAEPIMVSGNRMTGVLSCVANQPPPVDNGVPNTVVGVAFGQCAGL
ncbi:MAG: S8 family serine peptidase [Micromonosporaceae bacterium]|nr:S8 family serine peptidase [Micromonosporaceae bacterium]